MMEATYIVRPGLTIRVEAENQDALWDEIASAVEVFGEPCCGLCQSAEIRPVTRHVEQQKKQYTYREWTCLKCGAVLGEGSKQTGHRLFPHRKLDAKGKSDRQHGSAGEHRGWTHYRGDVEPEPSAPANADQKSSTHSAPPSPPETQRKPTETTVAQSPGYRVPTREEAGVPITSQQWTALQAACKSRHIHPEAFLKRFGYKQPRDIKASDYAERLKAAQNPDDELRRINKSMPAPRGVR
jgi:hypothetical protein